MIVWRDGKLVEAENSLSAEDRGWLIGDAVFETALFRENYLAFLSAHLGRLSVGIDVLGINAELSGVEMLGAARALSEQYGAIDRGAFRITVSRVGGRRGLAATAEARAQILASLTKLEPAPDAITVTISTFRRWSGSAAIGFKCVGAYAENLLARSEASERGAGEAIMLNEHGRVACGSSSNVFLIKGDKVLTPPQTEGAMPGVVRSVVIEESRKLGLSLSEAPISMSMLETGSLLLTNSLIGVVAANVGSTPGATSDAATAKIRDAYQRRLNAEFMRREDG